MACLDWPSSLREPEMADIWPDVREISNDSTHAFIGEVSPVFEFMRGVITWTNMDQVDEAKILGFLAAGRGTTNSFKVPHYKYEKMVGSIGTGLQFSANAAAGSSTISTNTAGLAVGDFVQIRTGVPRLYLITAAAGSSYTLFPRLRKASTSGDPILTLANFYPLSCAMLIAGGIGSAPVMPSRLNATMGRVVSSRTVEFIESNRRSDLA